MSAQVFAVVGPSGAGKDTLLAGLVRAGLVHRVRRVITRTPQPDDEPFEGVDDAEFERRLRAGLFALHWRAHGLGYGLPWAEFAPLADGRDVVFNGSRTMLEAASRVFPGLRVLLIDAPPALRARRLADRGREVPAEIAARLARETGALPAALPVMRIVNDAGPEEGIASLRAALAACRKTPA